MTLNHWIKTGVLSIGLFAACLTMAHSRHQEDIAVQMYTLRDVGSLEEQFSMAQRSGYHAVELVGTQGVDSYEMNRLLTAHQLDAMAAHVQLTDLRNDLNSVIRFNQAIENTVVIMPWLAAEDRPTTAQGWISLGRELDEIGKTLRHNGMLLAYHNHDFEMKKYDGKLALEWILEGSHADNLQLELDAAWVARGGQDPAKLIKQWRKRIFSLHVKDNSGIGTHDDEFNFTVVGDGIMSWQDEILPAAQKAGVQWYVVEHDLPADAEAVITEANQYLTGFLVQPH